jgi:serine/threonine protein phosphatase PrpC
MPYKDFIIPDPEIYHFDIQEEDDLLILCSDGLLLVYNEEQLAKEI